MQLNIETIEFKWFRYFQNHGYFAKLINIFSRIQRRLCIGPLINKVNYDLYALAKKEKPDVLFIYRGDLIHPDTLEKIKFDNPHIILVGYNNDDPFSPAYPKWLWRHFINCIPKYDLVLAYRKINIDDFLAAGAKRVELLRSWFIPERNYPLISMDRKKIDIDCDVVFVGHYEDDLRLQYLEEVVRQGYSLKLYGPGYDWDPVLSKSETLKHLIPVKLVWGDEYNKVLNNAKVALCFFSKLNRDTYTRRCFEIPASGTLLLSEYSDDLASLFLPDKEAVYFSSKKEMIDKIHWLLSDNNKLSEITIEGNKKVYSDGHDVMSRMKKVLQWVHEIKKKSEENSESIKAHN